VGKLQHDTLYIYGADALYERIDTVVAHDGEFCYTAVVDTVTPLWVLFPNKHREIVFADTIYQFLFGKHRAVAQIVAACQHTVEDFGTRTVFGTVAVILHTITVFVNHFCQAKARVVCGVRL
jgi:hypothetical protein